MENSFRRNLLKNRQPPIFPRRLQRSTFGRFRLNHRVRDVERVFPKSASPPEQLTKAMTLS